MRKRAVASMAGSQKKTEGRGRRKLPICLDAKVHFQNEKSPVIKLSPEEKLLIAKEALTSGSEAVCIKYNVSAREVKLFISRYKLKFKEIPQTERASREAVRRKKNAKLIDPVCGTDYSIEETNQRHIARLISGQDELRKYFNKVQYELMELRLLNKIK